MDLQATRGLNIDFSTQKYISIDVKQYDRNSRFILVTCYNHGSLMPINNNTCFAYVRYRKADERGVFNSCEITKDGKILIELTEQMLTVVGMSYVDLVIHEAIGLGVEITENENGEIQLVKTGENSILSTMTFNVNVHESAFDNKEIESSYEYDALNDLLIEAKVDYQNVIRECRISERNAKKSEDNAERYMNSAKDHMNDAELYMNNAKSYMDNSESYMNTTKQYMDTTNSYMEATNEYMTTTNDYMDSTESYMEATNEYMTTTNGYMNNAESYMKSANEYMTTTNGYMNNAESYMNDAEESKTIALNSANLAQSYTVGGTNTRENENNDNAKYYWNAIKNVVDGLNSGFIPMGTISFSELSTAEKDTGSLARLVFTP